LVLGEVAAVRFGAQLVAPEITRQQVAQQVQTSMALVALVALATRKVVVLGRAGLLLFKNFTSRDVNVGDLH